MGVGVTAHSVGGGSQGRAVTVGVALSVAVVRNSAYEISDLRGEFGAEYDIHGCGVLT